MAFHFRHSSLALSDAILNCELASQPETLLQQSDDSVRHHYRQQAASVGPVDANAVFTDCLQGSFAFETHYNHLMADFEILARLQARLDP